VPFLPSDNRVLYRPVWQGLQTALKEIFVEGRPADRVIQFHLKGAKKWGSSDRRLFAEALYDMVRWWRRILYVAGQSWSEQDTWPEVTDKLLAQVIEVWCLLNQVELGRGLEILGYNPQECLERWQDKGLPRAVRESIPNWLDQMGEAQLGAQRWATVLTVLNETAPIFLRANRLKITAVELKARLQSENLSAQLEDGDCLRLSQRANFWSNSSFQSGLFEVQDLGSQRVAPELGVEPGQRVVDACAGAGGKTLHLAALMKNQGRIVALDVHDRRLEELRKRASRAGATCIECRVIDNNKVIKRLHDSADRVLLDVPCSGLGVIRRNPDAKWKLTKTEVDRLVELQRDLLSRYTPMCRVGGRVVYATCSILPEENERQVAAFLAQNETSWSLESEHHFEPQSGGCDGFYLAVLSRQS